jgi:Rrf2 family protein
MRISRAAEYAVRTMMHLAMQEKDIISHISLISKTWEIPEKFLRKILKSLSKENLIITLRGTGGGIKLAKDSGEITLLNIIEAVDGPVYFNVCLIDPNQCKNTNWCPAHPVWKEVEKSFSQILKNVSLAYLVSRPGIIRHFSMKIKKK